MTYIIAAGIRFPDRSRALGRKDLGFRIWDLGSGSRIERKRHVLLKGAWRFSFRIVATVLSGCFGHHSAPGFSDLSDARAPLRCCFWLPIPKGMKSACEY